MLDARRFIVRGQVQGVGFRFHVAEVAQGAGVCGWVRNNLDGTVEALVEGDRTAVERVERAIRRGPPGARVERVDVEVVAPTARWTRFEISR